MTEKLSFDTFFVLIDTWCIRKKKEEKTRQNKLHSPVMNLKIWTKAVWSADRSILGYAGLGKDAVLSVCLPVSLSTHAQTLEERENVKFLTIVRKCVEIFFYEN